MEQALKSVELLLAWAIAFQSLEHLSRRGDHRAMHALRLVLTLTLGSIAGLALFGGFEATAPTSMAPLVVASVSLIPWLMLALLGTSLYLLYAYRGPYNGGADRMALLIQLMVTLAEFAPTQSLQEIALGYLALQTVLSYLIPGLVKIKNPEWRNGLALARVLTHTHYPVANRLRSLGQNIKLMRLTSGAILGFEVLFPLALLSRSSLLSALILAFLFHSTNSVGLGLNRFVWVWLASYPALFWFLTGPLAC